MPQSRRYRYTLSNMTVDRFLFHSKARIASKISEIFRSTLHGELSPRAMLRAMLKTLPFVATKSQHALQRNELISTLSQYFGEEIFRSLTDVTYNTKATTKARHILQTAVDQLAELAQLRLLSAKWDSCASTGAGRAER